MMDPRDRLEYGGPASDEIRPMRAVVACNADPRSEISTLDSDQTHSTRELLLLWGMLKSESARAQVLAVARSEVASRLG